MEEEEQEQFEEEMGGEEDEDWQVVDQGRTNLYDDIMRDRAQMKATEEAPTTSDTNPKKQKAAHEIADQLIKS